MAVSFSFGANLTDQSRNTTVYSGIATISGAAQGEGYFVFNGPGEVSINGGAWESSVNFQVGSNENINGWTMQLRHTTSQYFGQTVTQTMSVSSVTDDWSSTTEAGDPTPDNWNYTSVTNATEDAWYDSGEHYLTGMTTAAVLQGLIADQGGLTNVEIWYNGTNYGTSPPYYMYAGDRVKIRIKASATLGATRQVHITFNNGSQSTGYFSVTTRSPDITPNAFSFTDQVNTTVNTLYTSNSVTISGMEAGYDSPVTFPTKTNGTVQSPATNAYEVNINGTGWQNATGTLYIRNGQSIQLRMGSNGSIGAVATFGVSINGVTDYWTLTNDPTDTSPDPFTFNDVASVALGEQVASNTITVAGITTSVTASFTTNGGTGHQYSKNGGAWTNVANVSVANGDTLRLRMTVPGTAGQYGEIGVSIGSNPAVADTWRATAAASDSVPNAFTFTSVAGVDPQEIIQCLAPITVSGFNTYGSGTAISVVGGSYRINGGAWTDVAGTVYPGDSVEVRQTSASTLNTSTTTTLTIGGVSANFIVTTRSPDTNSQYVVTFRDSKYGIGF